MAKCTHIIDAGTLAPRPWENLDGLVCPELRSWKPLDPGLEAVYMEICLKNARVTQGEKGHQDLQVSNLNTDSSPALLGTVATRRWLGNEQTGSTMPLSQCSVFLPDLSQIFGSLWDTEAVQESVGKLPCPVSTFVKLKIFLTKHAEVSNIFP